MIITLRFRVRGRSLFSGGLVRPPETPALPRCGFFCSHSNNMGAVNMKIEKETRAQLKKARLIYEQVCDHLNALNREATDLESEMLRLQCVIKNKGRRKI